MKYLYYLTFLLFVFISTTGAFAQSFFLGDFSAAQQTEDVTSDATGTAVLALSEDGRSLRFIVSVEGLSGDIAAAHFHNASAGENGGVVRTITDDFSGGTAIGTWTSDDAEPFTGEQLRLLFSGDLYLNIHTGDHPAGEIRAQLRPISGAGLSASLDAAQQTQEVTSDATGTATLALTDVGLFYQVTVNGLSGDIAAAHFHNGAAGENGPVVRTIMFFEGNTAVGIWNNTEGGEAITNALRDALLTGDMYINIHTQDHPAGEIRGQVRLSDGWGFSAGLDAEQETHEVTSDATGTAALTLTEAGLLYQVTVNGLSGVIAAAHFHNGAAGENGPVVRTITDDFSGNTAVGVWKDSDAEPLTDALLQALFAGDLYLNVHTPDNGAGEIRGQVERNDGTSFRSALSAAQETHEVTSEAAGTSTMTLTEAGLDFQVTIYGLSGDLAAAHFHNGPAGENGPVVRTITDGFSGSTAIGTWTASDAEPLTDGLLDALLAGELYLNVHTPDHGAGEIRGQVYVSGGTALRADLTSAQETHEVTSEAAGTSTMTLTDAGLLFHLTVDGLSGDIAAAHFHNGEAGENGPVVRTIMFEGNTAQGLWRESDAEPLTIELRDAFLAGDLYLNVHTPDHGAGEIRGQVYVSGGIGAAVHLAAGQETHDVTSDAQGTSALTYTEEGLLFNITAEGLSGNIAAAHFHNAQLGLNGPVVRTIMFDGNTTFGVWRKSDAEPLTEALRDALIAGELYLNVHTPDHGAGEIRGQVNPQGVVVTSVEVVDSDVPEAFVLSQNYPNPFNPTTTIVFALTNVIPMPVSITVYNVLGQRVATLVDATLTGGRYQVTFDAGSLPSGVYQYRIDAGSEQLSRSMLLVK